MAGRLQRQVSRRVLGAGPPRGVPALSSQGAPAGFGAAGLPGTGRAAGPRDGEGLVKCVESRLHRATPRIPAAFRLLRGDRVLGRGGPVSALRRCNCPA